MADGYSHPSAPQFFEDFGYLGISCNAPMRLVHEDIARVVFLPFPPGFEQHHCPPSLPQLGAFRAEVGELSIDDDDRALVHELAKVDLGVGCDEGGVELIGKREQ